MRRTFLLLLVLIFCFFSLIFSQESNTAIEKACYSKGTTLIKIFKEMTTLPGRRGDYVTISGIVVEDYETSEKYKGVRFSYSSDKYGSNEYSVFLDLDEAIEAIQVIANMHKIFDSVAASNTEYSEVSYNSNGGLVTTIYTTEQGPRIAMEIGPYTVFLDIELIGDIVVNVERAVIWLNTK